MLSLYCYQHTFLGSFYFIEKLLLQHMWILLGNFNAFLKCFLLFLVPKGKLALLNNFCAVVTVEQCCRRWGRHFVTADL